MPKRDSAGRHVLGAAWQHVPAAGWIGRYQHSMLRGDLTAALVVTALMIPQALGYAALAGAPVQAGLYALPLALIVYALMGSSPQLVVGPVSTVSVLTGSIVAGRGVSDPAEAVAVAAALAMIAGLVLFIAGALRVGWVAEFLSKPITTGFVFGLAIVIVITEVPTLLGLGRATGSTLQKLDAVAAHLGDIDPTTAAIGLTSLVVLFAGSRLRPHVPWGLVLVVAGLVVSRASGLEDHGVAVVGRVPRGLPGLSLPDLTFGEIGNLVASGAAVALVGLTETLSAARLFGARHGDQVDANQELFASGMANVAAGLSGGIGVAGSLSKTAAADEAGGRSQVTGLVGAGLALLILVFFASSLSVLPRVVLSGVVIHAVWGLMDVRSLAKYRRIRRNDFVGSLVALFGVVLFGPLVGLLVAVAQSVLGLIYRSGQVEVDVLGKVKGEKAAWGSTESHPGLHTVGGILVLRLNTPLFWVNAASSASLILKAVAEAPDSRTVVIDLEATHQLDTTSADTLRELIEVLRGRGIDVYLVRVSRLARRVLGSADVIDELGLDHMWRTISQGVRAAKRAAKENDSPS
ncbi:MAG: SulP family inorganic anion transporter [Microthrixaceae bacterium]